MMGMEEREESSADEGGWNGVEGGRERCRRVWSGDDRFGGARGMEGVDMVVRVRGAERANGFEWVKVGR